MWFRLNNMKTTATLAALIWSLGLGLGTAQPPAASDGWAAKWIQAPWSTERDGAEPDGSRPMPEFRREFTVRAKVVKATLRIAGLGQYAVFLDGKPVPPAGL